MQLKDIEILNTLEAIAKTNQMLLLHSSQEKSDTLAIQNYLSVKHDLLTQFNNLLKDYQLSAKDLAEVAA